MNNKNADLIDDTSLKLNGLKAIFDLLFEHRDKVYNVETVADFAYYISKELEALQNAVNEIDYKAP